MVDEMAEVNPAEEDIDETDMDEDVEEDGDDDEQDAFTQMKPEELPAELQKRYRQMQADYTRKTQALANQRKEFDTIREKAEAFDELASRPEFIDLLGKLRNQADGESDLDEQDDNDEILAKYGDNAQGMKDLVNLVAKTVKNELRRELEPVTKSVKSSMAKERMSSLKEWVKSESEKNGFDLPDPSIYAPEIEALTKVGLSPSEAYRASLEFSKLKVRNPIKGQTTKKKSPMSPGVGSKSEQRSVGFTPDDVIRLRNEGKALPTISEIADLVKAGKWKGR